MLGLGSIVGTGIFVSIGIASGVAGASVVLAIVIASLLALCNALSSAQLAASHPTSGGTYEYGHVYLRPWLGFSAGWMFLCAKSASAATAALGFSGYTMVLLGLDGDSWRSALSLGSVVVLVVIVLGGMRRSSAVNAAIVSATIVSLVVFVVSGLGEVSRGGSERFTPFLAEEGWGGLRRLLEASALMFVAYTGYGRIATLGEEVREPRRTIPHAIVATLAISTVLYVAVGVVGIGAVGAEVFGAQSAERGAPLALTSRMVGPSWVGMVVSIGAISAMLGVLLNLVLGLSRVALAMGRRGDLPGVLAHVDSRGSSPTWSVVFVGAVILALSAMGDIGLAWSLSACTVLVYYAITNLAAIRLPDEHRLYPVWVAWVGLVVCLSLAVWVEPVALLAGAGVLAIGLVGRLVASRIGSGVWR